MNSSALSLSSSSSSSSSSLKHGVASSVSSRLFILLLLLLLLLLFQLDSASDRKKRTGIAVRVGTYCPPPEIFIRKRNGFLGFLRIQ